MSENLTLLANQKNAPIAKKTYEDFINIETKNPMEYQKDFLMKVLDDNKDTEYGKKYNFADIKSIEDFQNQVPVIIYEDIESEIERMKNGEKNVLTAYEFDHFNETSGTVGAKKAIPFTKEQAAIFTKYDYHYMNGLYTKCFGTKWMSGRTFATSEGNYKTLPSGLTIGCASAKMAQFIRGGEDALDQMRRVIYTSPLEATLPGKDIDTKYIHCRFALMDKNISSIVCGFYSHMMHLMTYIGDNYEMFIDDIEKGIISDEVKLPKSIRESLLKKIKPMPERAAELREVFKNGPLLFMPKVWPNLQFIVGVGGDGFKIYNENLTKHFHGGKVKNIFVGIKSTEGLYSVAFEEENINSVLAPGSCFMEFLPEDADNDFSKLVTLDKLEVGKIYELVITDLCGMYRYRLYDTVKVTGFLNKTPLVDFMYRSNNTINLQCENTTETALEFAAKNTADAVGFQMYDFVVYPDQKSVPAQYVFLFEQLPARQVDVDKDALEEVLLDKLCEANLEFQECYEEGLIQAPKAMFLQPETQLLYRDIQSYKGNSASQLKPVHVIKNKNQKNFFFSLLED